MAFSSDSIWWGLAIVLGAATLVIGGLSLIAFSVARRLMNATSPDFQFRIWHLLGLVAIAAVCFALSGYLKLALYFSILFVAVRPVEAGAAVATIALFIWWLSIRNK